MKPTPRRLFFSRLLAIVILGVLVTVAYFIIR